MGVIIARKSIQQVYYDEIFKLGFLEGVEWNWPPLLAFFLWLWCHKEIILYYVKVVAALKHVIWGVKIFQCQQMPYFSVECRWFLQFLKRKKKPKSFATLALHNFFTYAVTNFHKECLLSTFLLATSFSIAFLFDFDVNLISQVLIPKALFFG